jgi:hypothetical protein
MLFDKTTTTAGERYDPSLGTSWCQSASVRECEEHASCFPLRCSAYVRSASTSSSIGATEVTHSWEHLTLGTTDQAMTH